MKNLYGIVLIFSILIANNSCDKIKQYPAEPELDFKSSRLFDARDTLGNQVKCLEVELNFVDGDGDLFSPIDTTNLTSPVSTLFLTFYQKIKGTFIQVPDSLLLTPPYQHLPYSDIMQRTGQNKTQKGTIKYDYFFYYPMPFDTLEVEFYVVDMANNKSNVVRTPNAIVLQ